MSHTAAETVNVVAEMPEPDQGEVEAKPRPDPRITRMSVSAAAANAPPRIAGHATAEAGAPVAPAAAPRAAVVADPACGMD